MRRRSRAGGEPAKAQRRKTGARKSGIAPKAGHPRSTSTANLETEVARLARERDDALEREKATAEVLRVISSSPGQLEPIFQAMLEKATRLCEASFGNMLLYEAGLLRRVAFHNTPLKYNEYNEKQPLLNPEKVPSLGQLVRTKRPVQVVDMAVTEPDLPIYHLGGARTLLVVPMLKEDVLIGGMGIYRQEVRPFTDKQIELVQNFAAQAVIAIENARLLNELRQRTTDLTERTADLAEALKQQTATSEVLQVISSSPGDLEPVFASMLENAVRICDAKFGNIFRWDGDALRLVATHNTPPAFAEYRTHTPARAGTTSIVGRIVTTKTVVHIADAAALPAYVEERDPAFVAAVELGGVRTFLAVPMLKENELTGAFTVSRQEVRPFTDKQIALVTNFAAQAVIAIENARLLNELRELLQQQTATADVLKVISRSTFDLQSVLNTLVESAVKLCEADKGAMARQSGSTYHQVASHGYPAELDEYMKTHPIAIGRGTLVGRTVLEGKPVQIEDVLADPEYIFKDAARIGNYRTALGVPLLREGVPIGVFYLARSNARPFTEKQIELATTFADQAVIAIENTRLFEAEQQRTRELTEALEQQTATSEVLRVISSSPNELNPVFQTMLMNATRLCEAKFGILTLYEGERFRVVAMHNAPPALAEQWQGEPVLNPGPQTASARVAATKEVIHISDYAEEAAYKLRDPGAVSVAELGGARTFLAVPMLKENELVGIIHIYRQEVRPFADKQIELVKNFAAQAVIAIENTRLLNELRQRTSDLSEALEQQTATGEILASITGSIADTKPVFDAIVRNLMRLFDTRLAHVQLLRDQTVYLAAADVNEVDILAKQFPRPLDENSGGGRAMISKQVLQFVLGDPATPPLTQQFASELGLNAAIFAPMIGGDKVIGAIATARREAKAFNEKQVALIKAFADQAVIAIENARLLNELRQRTTDLTERTTELTEALEQQTATSEVLQVISSSPGDLQPVFAAMLEKAVRICEAEFGVLFLSEGDSFRTVALHGAPPAYAEARRREPVVRVNPGTALARAAATKQVVQIADIRSEPAYVSDPRRFAVLELAGARTMLMVPMLKEDALVGVVAIYRQEVRPFTDKQIELVKNFAAQAVIAIENTRLLNELRQRTDELGRSVEELRALGEVSQAVNSTLDLETVLSTIVANAAQLSGTEAGAIYVFDDRQREFRLRATYGMDRDLIDALAHADMGINEPNIALILSERDVIQVADLRDEAPNEINEITLRAGFRARLVAPLMRGEDVVGLLVVRRRAPGTFQQNTIDLIKTFAAQSAVAIENARLFQSVQTSLEDLRTTQDRLVQTQKLASLGQLTAGIAHEIKNPLNFVTNFSGVSAELIDELQENLGKVKADASTLAEITELTNTLRDNLDKVVQHGKRADAIVKNMLLHSREGSGEHRLVDVNALVEESLNLAYHGARAEKQGFKINLERSFDPAAGEIDVSPQEITRALLNLISNGFYAATKRKEHIDSEGFEPALTASTKNLGDRVEITIRDNGTGIPPDVKEKMFNPFFTTKPAGEGTGLGLSITHDIVVKQHSGSIEVESEPGEFTEVRVILPRAAAFVAGGRT